MNTKVRIHEDSRTSEVQKSINVITKLNPIKDVINTITSTVVSQAPSPTVKNKQDLLLDIYPYSTGKNRVSGKILVQLIKKTSTSFQLAQCIERELTKTKFKRKTYLSSRVKNCIRYLNKKKLRRHGYFITKKFDRYELISR